MNFDEYIGMQNTYYYITKKEYIYLKIQKGT